MAPIDFIHFLDGFLSSNPNLEYLNEAQTKIIKEKLGTVFNKITPSKEEPTYCSNSLSTIIWDQPLCNWKPYITEDTIKYVEHSC
jgi:hypothetical protein